MRYVIDADDRVVATDEGWDAFAAEAGFPEVVRPQPTLWDALTGTTVIHLWRAILTSVRERETSASFALRCDGPAIRRFVELGVTPASDGSVKFEAQVTRTEPRTPVTLLDVRVPRLADDLVRMCSWCCRIDADGWSEVEDGVRRLGIFLRSPMPTITHTICPDCRATAETSLTVAASGWRESNPHN